MDKLRSVRRCDRLCGLVVRVPGYRSRDPGFESPTLLDFLRSSGSGSGSTQPSEDELLEWKSSGSGSIKPILTAVGIRCADHATPSIRKSWH
jgi:hypothetical protein